MLRRKRANILGFCRRARPQPAEGGDAVHSIVLRPTVAFCHPAPAFPNPLRVPAGGVGRKAGCVLRRSVLLFLALAWSGSAAALCPPQRDAEVIAQGGAVVTGRVAETGSAARGSEGHHAVWARLEVTGRHSGQAPESVRLLAANAGLYTPRFRVGDVVTFIIHAPFGESTITLCDSREPPRG